MSNVRHLLWCDARDKQGGLVHALKCDEHHYSVVQGKRPETNTGGKAQMPNHYRCTITCAFCGNRKHYEDGCYHKKRLSAKLKNEAQNGGGSARGKSNGLQRKGKSQGQGKVKGQGSRALTRITRTRTRTVFKFPDQL